MFSPVENISMGVIDVENSRQEHSELVGRESQKIYDRFQRLTSSPKDLAVLNSWYEQGFDSLRTRNLTLTSEVVEHVGKKYNIDFDFINRSINGIRFGH